MNAHRRFAIGVALLLLAGGGVRLAAYEAARPVELIGDELYYVAVAGQLAQGRPHYHLRSNTAAWRPPGNAWVMSWAVDNGIPLLPQTLLLYAKPLVSMQIFLGTLLVGATALLGRALFGERVGLLAGAVAAVYPPFVAHSHYLWSEMLFGLLVTSALAVIVWNREWRSAWAAVGAGLLLGAAILTREIAGGVALVGGAWWAWGASCAERRRMIGLALLMGVVATAVVLPWTIRNYRTLHRVVPVSTIGWFAAAEGNSLDHPDWLAPIGPSGLDFRRTYFSIGDEVERMEFARAWLVERVQAEQPGWLARKLVRGLAQLFSPESYLLYKLSRGSYGEVPLWKARGILVGSVLFYVLLVCAAVLGIASSPDRGARALACAILGMVMAVHVLSNSGVRFRVPWMPVMIVYASAAALTWRQRWGALDMRGRVGAAVALVVFAGVCLPFYAEPARAVWEAGPRAVKR